MYCIVIGCGKVGSKLANVLSVEGHDVVIVDENHNSFELLGDEFVGVKIEGIPIDQDILKKAGIENADVLAAVTPDDNMNIMVSQIAKEIYEVPKVLARVYNPLREKVFQQFGLDTICPTSITVDLVKSILLGNKIVCEHTIGNATAVFKHEVPERHYIGKRVKDIMENEDKHVFGVIRKGVMLQPKLGLVIEENDELVLSSIIV